MVILNPKCFHCIHICNLTLLCDNSTNTREAVSAKNVNNASIRHKSNKMERKNNVQESGDLYFYLN